VGLSLVSSAMATSEFKKFPKITERNTELQGISLAQNGQDYNIESPIPQIISANRRALL
jgi:hypothetical protein